MSSAHPLAWPVSSPRTKTPSRANFKCTFAAARDGILKELFLMGIGGHHVVISTNVELRRDGLPYATKRDPDDVGVAVYWFDGARQQVMCCDRWDRVRDNMRAIEKTINGMRGISRWGSSDIVSRVFSGFSALPSEGGSEPHILWWAKILDFDSMKHLTRELIRFRFHDLSRIRHPDRGGSHVEMVELNAAYEAGLSWSRHLDR